MIKELNKFIQLGIKISIDDFGKGYSSYSYLKKCKINEVKLDKTFLIDINDEYHQKIISSIVYLCEQTKLNLVVEGVETIEELNILKKLNCHIFQGYYYSKPLNKEDFLMYISKK